MEIATLKLFLDVMHHRSFTEVAKHQGVAPSSISRSIAGLESELGVRLFQRSTRKLEPTEAGLAYFERIAPVVSELEAAEQIAQDVKETPKGTLRVTVPTVYGQRHIVPLLPALQERYPELSIELVMSDAYLDLISERIDLAVRLGTLSDSSLIARQLRTMRFHICASPAYLERQGRPDAPDDIRDHQCLLFPRTGYNMNWLFKDDNDAIVEIPVNGQTLITNSEAIRQCALAGMGLALLPDWLIEEDLESGKLVGLLDSYTVSATDFKSAVWVLRPSRTYVPLKVRVFEDYLFRTAGPKR